MKVRKNSLWELQKTRIGFTIIKVVFERGVIWSWGQGGQDNGENGSTGNTILFCVLKRNL